MKRVPTCLSLAMLVCIARVSCEPPLSGPPGPIHVPPPILSFVQISIVSIAPSQLLVGQGAVVTYSLSLGGIAPKPTTGFVGGSFQGQALQQPNGGSAQVITLQPNAKVTGTLVIPSANQGPGDIAISFYPPAPAGCGGSMVNIIRCRLKPLASADQTENVVQPTVIMRIAGTTYANISKPDSGDGAAGINGYQCVHHVPGCGWWGNSGSDKYFNQKALPAGVTLAAPPVFTPYWPLGIDSGNDGAWTWLNSSGTYYSHLDVSNPGQPAVKWNNTCWGPFSGKDLYYSISFLVSMPKGTDLGEPAYDPTIQTSSPCLPQGYSATPQGAPPVTTPPLTLHLVRTGNYFVGTFGSNSPGKIQSISSGEGFTIVLLKKSNFNGNCAGAGNVTLNPQPQVISGSQLAGLYGSAQPAYPLTIQACVNDTTIASTRQSVGIVITYVPSAP